MNSTPKEMIQNCCNCCLNVKEEKTANSSTHLLIREDDCDEPDLEIGVVNALAYIDNTTIDNFKSRILLETEKHSNSRPTELALCKQCGLLVKKLFRLRRKFNRQSNLNSILSKANQANEINPIKQEVVWISPESDIQGDDCGFQVENISEEPCFDSDTNGSLPPQEHKDDHFDPINNTSTVKKEIDVDSVLNIYTADNVPQITNLQLSAKLPRVGKYQKNSQVVSNSVKKKQISNRTSKRLFDIRRQPVTVTVTPTNTTKPKIRKKFDPDPNFEPGQRQKKRLKYKMKGKHKRNSISCEKRLEILKELNSKSQTEVAKEYCLSHSTVSRIKNSNKNIEDLVGLGQHSRKRIRGDAHLDVDEALFKWYKERLSQNFSCNGPLLLAKANEFFKHLHPDGAWSSSNGWMWRFQKRHGIRFSKVPEEVKKLQ